MIGWIILAIWIISIILGVSSFIAYKFTNEDIFIGILIIWAIIFIGIPLIIIMAILTELINSWTE
ncbi:MAG: hypothetical protein Q8L29_04230, partial [archaeon]|nr:hypothetical protein [archaeon]